MVNYQLQPGAMVWGKLGYMKNEGTGNNFVIGFDNPSIGDTEVVLTTLGTTWTLNQTTVLDANCGMSRQNQTVLPADFGTNYGLQLGIPGTNNPNDIRESGMPAMNNGYGLIGTAGQWSPNWMPLAQRDQLLGYRWPDQGLHQSRDPHGDGLRPPRAEPPPGRVG
jgi:hypothetical protein